MADQFELIPYSVIASLEKKLTWLASKRIDGVLMSELLAGIVSSIDAIKTVLSAAERTQEQDPWVRVWIRMLKDRLHAADDLFDGIVTEYLRLKPPPPPHAAAAAAAAVAADSDTATAGAVAAGDSSNTTATEELRLHGGKVSGFFSRANGIVFRFRVAGKIDKIGKDLNEIAERVYMLGLVQEYRRSAGSVTTLTGSSNIIGRDFEKRKIVNLLNKQDGGKNVSVIGVVGERGIGKTVFVQMVYDDNDVKKLFEKRVWVHASDDFDVKKVAFIILKELIGMKTDDQQSLEGLLLKLDDTLSGTKYLLVLDGMLAAPQVLGQWNQLKTYLMGGAKGSKILVTTRSEILAEKMGATKQYHLRGLSEEKSRILFRKLMFGKDEQYIMESHQLGKISQEVAKCKGVPLTIKKVAAELRVKNYEWMDVLESDIEELDEVEHDMYSKELSYGLLSDQLKQCFAYCSLCHKDWEIGKNELIQLWMAQGYLGWLDDEQQKEDVGNNYVKDLLDMSFFQEAKNYDCCDPVSLKIGDEMQCLALLVAGSDFYLDGGRGVNTPTHMRFSLESNTINSLGSLDASRLRTFILQQANDWDTAQMTRLLSVIFRFKRLRVLNLSQSSLKKLPVLIDRLKHLRYLDLSWCLQLASLPRSIGNLFNLQTLKLTGCEKLQFSTEVVTKLINLRHLEIGRCKAFEQSMPTGLGELTSLQSLTTFYVAVADGEKERAGKLNGLQHLNNLRGNLEIEALDQVRDVEKEASNVNLEGKELLESLALNWGNQDKAGDSQQLLEKLRPSQKLKQLNVRWYPGGRFSDWLSSMENLSHIILFGFHNCKNLPPLEHLPRLKSLEIVSMKALEYIQFQAETSTPTTFFNSLEELKFSGCYKLRGWKRKEGNYSFSPPPFPKLSKLIMKRCPRLTLLPTFPDVEILELCESTAKPLKDTVEAASSSSSSTTTTPLSKLKSLKIEGKLHRMLPSRWKQNLTSLATLEIGDVEDLQDWFEDDAQVPCLQEIVVYASSLTALPDKMCHWKTLRHIKILGCHKLASLPEQIHQLDNLVTLEIRHCRILLERCQIETGADWPKISRVIKEKRLAVKDVVKEALLKSSNLFIIYSFDGAATSETLHEELTPRKQPSPPNP